MTVAQTPTTQAATSQVPIVALQQYNPELDQSTNNAVLQKNFSSIQTAVNKLGTNLLFGNNSTKQQSIGASYARLTTFDPSGAVSFNPNGGLVLIIAKINAYVTNPGAGCDVTFQMLLDGAVIDTSENSGSA